MVQLQTPKGKILAAAVELKSNEYEELETLIYKQYKVKPDRQRLTVGPEKRVLDNGSGLKEQGITSNSVIVVKDLGPQIPWKTVFLVEYFGPIWIHCLFYFFPSWFYTLPVSGSYAHSRMQTLTLLMTVAHYVKREYETLYVHRFSLASMPWRNLPKNCAHYWLLGGLLVAYPMYAPTFRPSTILQVRYVPFLPADVGLILLWLFAETSNFATHLILRNLRPEGTKARKIPRGYGFDLVSCPNYFFEILGWVCLTGLTGSPYVFFFTFVGAVQMYFWAVKKHARYVAEFGRSYPVSRKVLVPFLL